GVAVNGNTGAGFSDAPVITVDGNVGQSRTFVVRAANVTIRSLAIFNSSAHGILLDGAAATGAVIAGNYIGVTPTLIRGTANRGSGVALVGGATNNIIGGTTFADKNIIGGNAIAGVLIQGAGTSGNLVQGNSIGTDPFGSITLSNDMFGVEITGGATENTIGGTTAAARNLICRNSVGVNITGTG